MTRGGRRTPPPTRAPAGDSLTWERREATFSQIRDRMTNSPRNGGKLAPRLLPEAWGHQRPAVKESAARRPLSQIPVRTAFR